MICILLSCGKACHKQDVIPHIIGDEKEVPLAVVSPEGPKTVVADPRAATVGFIRPSNVGPTELSYPEIG
jgi:hypothetical protein